MSTLTASVDVSASPSQVWRALTDRDTIRRFFLGAEVDTTWEPGSPITWRGEYDGRRYEDKGEVVEVTPEQKLEFTHFSPLTGQEDKPENYHHVRFLLEEQGDHTTVRVEQEPGGGDEQRQVWETVLQNLQDIVEEGRS